MIPRLFLVLALATLSIASGCPFAHLRKEGALGDIPELSHEKLADFVAKIKEYAPDGDISQLGEHPSSGGVRDDL
ncbi:hypothetical protein N7466_008894 [Penicillium verhagenii]|uniref:uncharacterized protein n=1 Tax=Penicillium verhagenii TaxID=1562060 RepID=UPI0025459398|nr:uncharacterized protein N7466_008894 [Penicillium verhagenii]KAJ5924707.1 hypothetical protein N7466_008894 [Penicillium verhagenii]